MSIHKSYFSRNNTMVSNSYVNTGRNPIVELFFGGVADYIAPNGFSRFIFDIDLDDLRTKISDGDVPTGCTSSNLTHTLRMTNTSSFDEELLNDKWSNGRRRATSFDLVLYRIPKVSGATGAIQSWDEGVGYDYYQGKNLTTTNTLSFIEALETEKSYSNRPSNFYERQTINDWSQDGVYDNENSNDITGLNYSGLTIVDTQHFEFGNEDIDLDMSSEINALLTGGTTGLTGWGISFVPDVENITGLTENYSVGFFSRHTQTFYEPYLETSYIDLIDDDRNSFYETRNNNLFLYVYSSGDAQNLDDNPTINLLDANGDAISGFTGLSSCQVSKGVYKISISGLTAATTPCIMYDTWTGLEVDGNSLSDVENQFIINPLSDLYTIGSSTQDSGIYGFDFYGIKQDEKILNTDVRKVNVEIKKAYSNNEILDKLSVYYRIYVREGKTEVQVQNWTSLNKVPDGYYFIFDTRDKIPNEYYLDIKVESNGEINTYKREIKFQIVNKK